MTIRSIKKVDFMAEDGFSLGHGSMGQVYLAYEKPLGRYVALKITDFKTNREAQLAAQLDHINVIKILQSSVHKGRNVFTMELIKGVTISDVVSTLGKIPVKSAIHFTLQMARALVIGERLKIVHRDIKPNNVMLARSTGDQIGVKVLDFGLAKKLSDEHFTGSTPNGQLGVKWFMAPEAFGPEKIRDHLADTYALGRVLLYMLLGEHYGNHRRHTLPPETELDNQFGANVRELLVTLLAQNREDRISTAEEVVHRLEACLNNGLKASPEEELEFTTQLTMMIRQAEVDMEKKISHFKAIWIQQRKKRPLTQVYQFMFNRRRKKSTVARRKKAYRVLSRSAVGALGLIACLPIIAELFSREDKGSDTDPPGHITDTQFTQELAKALDARIEASPLKRTVYLPPDKTDQCKQLVDRGVPEAMYTLGAMLKPIDLIQSKKLFFSAGQFFLEQKRFELSLNAYVEIVLLDISDAEKAEANEELAKLMKDLRANVKKVDFTKVKWAIQVWAEKGHVEAMLYLGNQLKTQEAYAEAYRFFQMASSRSKEAMVETARMILMEQGTPYRVDKARKLLEEAVQEDSSEAQVLLGEMYLWGKHVQAEPERGIRYLKLASNKDHPRAVMLLGMCYKEGKGVPQDIFKAVDLLNQASGLGETGSFCELGTIYLRGDGIGRNPRKAADFFEKGHLNGDKESTYQLAVSFHTGEGRRKDAEFAELLFKESVRRGSVKGVTWCNYHGIKI